MCVCVNAELVLVIKIWNWPIKNFSETCRTPHRIIHSRYVECDLGVAEPESLTSLGGSAPGVVDGILSLPFSWVAVSPLQNKIGLSMGHTVANSQCLLRMSAGLLLPSFQWNEMYLAAIASLTR